MLVANIKIEKPLKYQRRLGLGLSQTLTRVGLEPRPLDPVSEALTTRPKKGHLFKVDSLRKPHLVWML